MLLWMSLLMVFVAAFTATLLMEWWREMKIISILSHHEKSIKIVIYLLKKRKNSRRKAFIHHIMGFITNILTQCLPAVLLCVDWNWNWNSNTPTWCNFVFYLCLSNKRQFFSVQFFPLPSPCFFFDLLGQAHHHVRPLHISTTNNINRKNVSKKAHVLW